MPSKSTKSTDSVLIAIIAEFPTGDRALHTMTCAGLVPADERLEVAGVRAVLAAEKHGCPVRIDVTVMAAAAAPVTATATRVA